MFQIVVVSLCLVLLIVSIADPAPPVDLKADKPGSIRFFGSPDAELFTKEIAESYKGVLRKNYISEPGGGYPPGFLHASPPGQGWSGTFWTRDGGTFMREMVLWGNFEHACLTVDCLIDMVTKNVEGFYSFPEYFQGSTPGSGTELDGTSAIVIGMVMLWQRLPEGDPHKERIYKFLHQPESPVRYMHKRLELGPLVAGSGEFGGGCGIPGEWYNVVQNNLAMLALTAAADIESEAGDRDTAKLYRDDARKIRDNMEKYLVDDDGAWIWCVDTKSHKPDPAIINHDINKGFGGLNGVACMYSDALGLTPLESGWKGIEHCKRTFDKLYAYPLRREQFEKYGIWSQFDVFRSGCHSSPSYGDGYALQTMLLFDKLEMAEKSLAWLAKCTYDPIPELVVNRESRYYFYERTYTPDAVGKTEIVEGCGALNLVNVTEPIKAARLILGVDDTSLAEVRIIPRVPPGWKGVEAVNWPIRTSRGMVRADIRFEKTGNGARFKLTLHPGQLIPKLAVRMPSGGGMVWEKRTDVTGVELVVDGDIGNVMPNTAIKGGTQKPDF